MAAVRTAEEIRDRILEHARRAVSRPSMWVLTGSELESTVTYLLDLALFADGRTDEVGTARSHSLRYGKNGVTGPFRAVFGDALDLRGETAVMMAHLLHRFGYLDVESHVESKQFDDLRADMRNRFDEVDLFASDLVADLGEPTFRVRDDAWAYASRDLSAGWVYFSFHRPLTGSTYEPGSGRWTSTAESDRLLRCAWTSEGDFEETFALTTFTKLQRWGSGWDWNHSWRSNGGPPGVREQLQAIHDADPSQRLRRPGFAE